MASFDISLLSNNSSPRVVSSDMTTRTVLTIGATVDGRSNKPTQPWSEQPACSMNSSSNYLSQDMLLGSQADSSLVGNQGNDSLWTGSDMLRMQTQTGLNTVENLIVQQSPLNCTGELQSKPISIQQVGQNTGFCYGDNSLMLLKNLTTTLFTAADIVTSV